MSEGYSDTRNSRITLIPFEQRYLLLLLLYIQSIFRSRNAFLIPTRPSGLTDAINEMLGDYSMTLICYLYIMHMPTE